MSIYAPGRGYQGGKRKPAPNPWAHIPSGGELRHREIGGTFVPSIPAAAATAAGLPAQTTRPTPQQQPSAPASASPAASSLIAAVSGLLSPGPSVREIAEAAHTLGVKPLDVASTISSPAKINSALASAAHLLSGNPAPRPAAKVVDTFKPTGPTPQIRAVEVQDHKDFLRETGGVPAPVDRGRVSPQARGISDAPFTKAQLHPNEKNVGEHEIEGGAPYFTPDEAARIARLRQAGAKAQQAGDLQQAHLLLGAAHELTNWARNGKPNQPHMTDVPVNPDPLGKKTLGTVTAAQLVAANKAGTLRINKRGVISTPAARRALHAVLAARKAVAGSRILPSVKPGGGPHTPEEYATLFEEESRKQGVKLTPHEIAEGVGVVFAESAGNASEQRQGPGGHIGALAESPEFGTVQERLNPRTAIAAGIKQFMADGRSWNPAWVHWQEIQGEEETGADRAAQYLPIARQVAQGGAGVDPQAKARLQQATLAAEALGIHLPSPGAKHGDVTFVHQTAKTALQWAEGALGVTTGTPREVHFAELVGGVTDPWCAVFVSTALKKVGIEPPANPSYSGAFAEGWKGGTKLGTTDLAKAKPGDLLIFDWGNGGETDHVAIYKGGGQMIGGNQGAGEVNQAEVPAGNIVAIVRPHYQGKVVAVSNAPVASTGTNSAVGASTAAGTTGATGTTGTAGTGRQERPFLTSGATVPISELLALQSLLATNQTKEPEQGEGKGTIARILARRRL